MPNPPEQSGTASFEELGRVLLSLSDGLRAAVEQRFGVRLDGDATDVAGGDECAIWRVGRLVVRIAPAWRTDADLTWIHDLVAHIARSVPEALAPLIARDGTTFFRYEEHPVSLFPFVDAEPIARTPALVSAAGALLARVHHAIRDWSPNAVRRTIPERRRRIRLPDALDDEDLDHWHESLARRGAERAVIHGDFYRRNILERNGHIVALIDWDEAHEDYLAQEIAWSLWEFSKSEGLLDGRLVSAFLDGYVSAGGRPPADFRSDAVHFIRWRLRDELHLQLSALAFGEPVDQEYFDAEMKAFTALRQTALLPGS